VSGKVALSGKLICASSDEAHLIRQFLPEHIRLTRLEPGCLSFEVTETDDPLVWRVEELFADPAAFEAHQARTKASEWARETAAIRRDYSIRTLES
jgi:quinol monooxygenase YgiN